MGNKHTDPKKVAIWLNIACIWRLIISLIGMMEIFHWKLSIKMKTILWWWKHNWMHKKEWLALENFSYNETTWTNIYALPHTTITPKKWLRLTLFWLDKLGSWLGIILGIKKHIQWSSWKKTTIQWQKSIMHGVRLTNTQLTTNQPPIGMTLTQALHASYM